MAFKELDAVAVKTDITQDYLDQKGWINKDLPPGGIPAGTSGTVLEDYIPGWYLVEFSNRKGETITILSLPEDKLTLVQSANAGPSDLGSK